MYNPMKFCMSFQKGKINMQEKINCYQEILSLEPASKLFFPLAKLYLQIDNKNKAKEILQFGLKNHPDHLEANLLLLEILWEKGEKSEATEILTRITSSLKKYLGFWLAWAEKSKDEENLDLATSLHFIAFNLSGNISNLSQMLFQGSQALLNKEFKGKIRSGDNIADQDDRDPGNLKKAETMKGEVWFDHESADYKEEIEGNFQEIEGNDWPDYRTKTMADILVEQGDYNRALDIYNELIEQVDSEEEKQAIEDQLIKLKEKIQANDQVENIESASENSYQKIVNKKIIDKLDALANRLEARKK